MKGTPNDDYRKLDWSLCSASGKTSPAAAYGFYLDTQFRAHRKGAMPATTFADFAPLLNAATKFEIIDGKIASSDDLAFTYGKYSIAPNGIETGYYVHVWRRDANSNWRLVVDVQNPLPKTDK